MATYSYYYPSPVYLGQYGYYNVRIGNSNISFYICRDNNNSSDMIFKAGYCGNPSTAPWNTMKSQYLMPWSSDTSIANSTDLAFRVYYDSNASDVYWVDWANPIKREQSWSHQVTVNNIQVLSSGNILEIEDSSSGSGSTEQPSDCPNPYDSVVSAIYTAAAVPICLCFFFVIYKMFMRLRG